MIKKITLTLRAKLLLVTLTLLLIPIVGYHYLQEIESYLRREQERALLERARSIAVLIADNAQALESVDQQRATTQHLFVRPLRGPVQVDGYADDWRMYEDRAQTFGNSDVSFRLQLGSFKNELYALLRVNDGKIVYRDPASADYERCDHVEIEVQDRAGATQRYVLATSAPGWVNVMRMPQDSDDDPQPERRIKAEWQEAALGYSVELRIPESLLGARLAFRVVDVDDAATRVVNAVASTAGGGAVATPGTVGMPSPRVQKLLAALTPIGSRTWVTDRDKRVIALQGALHEGAEVDSGEASVDDVAASSGLFHGVYRWLLAQPAQEFVDELSAASRLDGPEVSAVVTAGRPQASWRQTPDRRVNILTAVHPILVDGRTLGVVAVEQTSNSILLLQNRALEVLLNTSVLVFSAALVVLLVALGISQRVRRLRNEASAAITSDGRVRDVKIDAGDADEFGDLALSVQDMLRRLSQYNRYLETLAGKLSHELRTPISVVRSSLDNLEGAGAEVERAVFLRRARDGLERLSDIVKRMGEAARVEQALRTEHRREFDLEPVVRGAIEGYQSAYPQCRFEWVVAPDPMRPAFTVRGAPELLLQLLDKLIANAMEFTAPAAPIIVRLEADAHDIILSVLNEGPSLPEEMRDRLFDSMVSVRAKNADAPHLGLGLYIVRLIAEFHGGVVQAANRSEAPGVVFQVRIPRV